jgi:hypothetical protein
MDVKLLAIVSRFQFACAMMDPFPEFHHNTD